MIQRIQSIFLLLASACAFGLLGLPFATTNSSALKSTTVFSDSLYNLNDNLLLMILFCAAGGLTLISIFLYKNRKTQLLVGRFGIIANIIGLVWAIVFYMQQSQNFADDAKVDDGLGLYLPIVFLIFAFLAQRYIVKDEKLVQSMDRLR